MASAAAGQGAVCSGSTVAVVVSRPWQSGSACDRIGSLDFEESVFESLSNRTVAPRRRGVASRLAARAADCAGARRYP